jgi:hypothetical protein
LRALDFPQAQEVRCGSHSQGFPQDQYSWQRCDFDAGLRLGVGLRRNAGAQDRARLGDAIHLSLLFGEPEPFVELPAELADEIGIKGGGKVKVTSARGEFIAKAMVTRRIKPMMIDGKKAYQIGIPIHWGYRGIAEDEGRTARTPINLLSPTVVDPNAFTLEFKGFLVKLERA